jgi:hypothetical protein
VKVEIFLRNENIWLTQAKISELFGVERSVVTKHLQNIYADNKLIKEATSAKIAQVQIEINRIVTMHLDFAEMQAQRGIIMNMKDWVSKLDAFLKLNEKQILTNAGLVSHEVAEALALSEYEKYRISQDKNYVSDFDRKVKKLLDMAKKEKR